MKREVKIGLYMLLMLVALYWGINFLRGRDIFGSSQTYYATYEEVTGLQKSSGVVVKGVKVGVVSDIIYDPSRSDLVTLALSIESKYRIPENSLARIFSSGLMEGKAIEIVMGNSPEYLNNRDTLHSETDPGLLEVAGSGIGNLTNKISQVADNVSKMMAAVTSLLEENRVSIDAMLANVTQLSASLAAEGETLRRTLANVEKFTAALAGNSDNIDATLDNINTFSNSLAEVDLERLDNSLAQLDAMLADVRTGHGTLGKFMADDSLYNSLARASNDLSLLLEDIKAHPGRYVTISVFGRRDR